MSAPIAILRSGGCEREYWKLSWLCPVSSAQCAVQNPRSRRSCPPNRCIGDTIAKGNRRRGCGGLGLFELADGRNSGLGACGMFMDVSDADDLIDSIEDAIRADPIAVSG
jgi:hypothetical protein